MNEKTVWDYLSPKIGNPYGVAGLMGNLHAESAFNPRNLQNSYEKKLGMTDDSYTQAVDDGTYANFVNDRAGYGLAQWTHWSRKQALLDFARAHGQSIGDLETQLYFLWQEIQSYKGVYNTLKNATSVREASDAVLHGYEGPADQSEAAEQRRAGFGQTYYDRFAGQGTGEGSTGGKGMRELTIYRRLFYEADCYAKGKRQENSGVQVHSTGANNPYLCRYVGPDDGRLGPNKYGNTHNRPGRDVCASAYIGKLADGTVAVYQALPWDYRCWLSGNGNNGNANRMGYAGFEVCEDKLEDEGYFRAAVMGASVLLTAHLCTLYGVGVDKVRDHSELHRMGLASNHADITSWLKKFGLTMDDYRAAVAEALADGVHVTYIDCDEEPAADSDDETAAFTAEVTSTGAYLNIRAARSTESESLKKLYRGTIVEVLDGSDPTWWRVRSEGVKGYAMAVDVETGARWLTRQGGEEATPPLEETPGGKTVVFTGNNVNLRVGNGTEFDRIAAASVGTELPWVATSQNGWHAVLYNKQVVWCSGEFAVVRG